jgi:TolB-like protein/Tfp pilus assembly protein PilF
MSFFEELKRRNVVRVGIAYAVAAWVLLQLTDVVGEILELPEWGGKLILLAVVVGFIPALILAWAFEWTPEGVKRESEVDRSQSISQQTGKKLNAVILVLMAVAITYLLFDKFYLSALGSGSRETLAVTEVLAPPEPLPPGQTATGAPSVAVLPFLNMSADAEQEYFSDGITEEIINALVRVPGIKVAARTSVFAFKGQEKDIRAIGDELGVTHVVEGSVRSDGTQLRITAQLIQVKDGFHLWSETFDRERINVFAIQEEIAAAIAGVLNEQLGAKTALPEAPHISVQAYDDYLRGRAHLRARSDVDLEQANQLFLKVTEAYPDYAPGWAALAITADVMDNEAAAEVAAQRALAIDPDNVDALNALGAVYREAWRWQEAEALFNRALAIDPDSAELLEDVAEFMAGTARVAEQLEVAERGYAIDPYLDPLVGVYAQALITAGEAGLALEVLNRAEARGGAEWLRATKLMVYMLIDDNDAFRRLISSLEISEEDRAVALAALDDPGNPQNMEALRNTVPRRQIIGDSIFVKDSVALLVLLQLGDVESVLDAIQQRLELNNWGSTEYWFMPHMAGLRAHPRFTELLDMTNLPAYWDQAGWPEFCARGVDGVIQCH